MLNSRSATPPDQLELVAAGTTGHYINSPLSALGASEQDKAFHALSGAWAFATRAKGYSLNRPLPGHGFSVATKSARIPEGVSTTFSTRTGKLFSRSRLRS